MFLFFLFLFGFHPICLSRILECWSSTTHIRSFERNESQPISFVFAIILNKKAKINEILTVIVLNSKNKNKNNGRQTTATQTINKYNRIFVQIVPLLVLIAHLTHQLTVNFVSVCCSNTMHIHASISQSCVQRDMKLKLFKNKQKKACYIITFRNQTAKNQH